MPHRRVVGLALGALTAAAMFISAVPAATATAPNAQPTASPSRAPSRGSLTTVVAGTVSGVAQTGTLTVDHFVRQGNSILAVGDLVLGGQNLGTIQAPVAVTDPPGSCQILHLELGPLYLNILGLQVHLNEVVLDITAQQGAGNLLGNLLCAVAGLLNNNGALSAITALLNQILAALNGL